MSASKPDCEKERNVMPTGTYVGSVHILEDPTCHGVARKVRAQMRTLENNGLRCDIATYKTPTSFIPRLIHWLPFLPSLEQWPDVGEVASRDFLYIRRPQTTKGFLRFLEKVRKANPNIIIILEIPTYPYDNEVTTLTSKVTIAKDRKYRPLLKNYLDRIADLTGQSEIFNIRTLPIHNGIEITNVTTRIPSFDKKEIHILAASWFQKWHGCDRMINGLKVYYANGTVPIPVILHVAGEGPEIDHLHQLADDEDVKDAVIFHGMMDADGLAGLYDACTLAVECLGTHRKGLTLSSSLKSREYLAKGMPFIYSGEIDVFTDRWIDFCMQVPSDESPIDISSIVRFHNELYERYGEELLIDKIRAFAEETVSMDKAFSSVIQYLQKHCRNDRRTEGNEG